METAAKEALGNETPGMGDANLQNKSDAKPENMIGKFVPTILGSGEATHVTVQHVLIGFKGSVRGKMIERSREDAENLANEILAKAQAGENFDALVKEYTDDSPPGIYHMANFNQDSDLRNPVLEMRVYPRDKMVGAFGNVGFPLKVGEVGLANHDMKESPFGWHIIKRLK